VKAYGCVAVIVDSLSGGHALDENSAAMRTLLQALVGLAGRLQVPVIGVHHARKRNDLEGAKLTLDRVRGSSTITQFARSVFGMYRLKDSLTEPVRIEPLKSTFGKPPEPFGMTITDFGLSFHVAPREDKPPTTTDRCIEWLSEALERRPLKYSELLTRAEEEGGFTKNALWRARDKLGVYTVQGHWTLPAGGHSR